MEDNKDYQQISGWGIDADPEDEPNYPIKKYTGDDHNRSNWERPQLQVQDVEILKSNERPSLSAVFGTASPPTGLSGVIRRHAFKYSENSYGHWLPLLLADRINVVEGIIEDLSEGVIPNIFAERGWKADFKYNKGALAKKVLIRAAVLGVIVICLSKKKKRKSFFG
ncbi:hypothetical protein SAMN06265348_102151 [Pedobacter westerhofensis]|uniref:Uncharacterized protein n=1 Tax=Pedobacter westerhofensis TaxID=425512 RepID=A0A521BBX8_9SPHI|nr:hypothetical protein [Pedobacter westerhofensis]SMO44260.1 hypothetical protein SAMN06265348_102151 [Pedobacter westerhofensis]